MGTYSGSIGYVLKDNSVASAQAEHCKETTTVSWTPFTCTIPPDLTANTAYKMACEMTASNLVQMSDWDGIREYWLVIGNNYNNALTVSGKLNGINNLFNLNFWRSPAELTECSSSGCWYGKPSPMPGYENEVVLTNRTNPHTKSLTTGINLTDPTKITPGRYYVVCNSRLDDLNMCSGNPFISYPNSGFQDCGGVRSRVVLNVKCKGKDKGNADCNAVVDATDYAVWKGEFDYITRDFDPDQSSDFNGDGFSTLEDFEIWRQNTTGF